MVGRALAADAVPGEDYCDRLVSSITFFGNEITKPQVLLRELAVRSGEPCSIDDIIDSIQSIMDLGLFKSVRAELHLQEELLELQFFVVEKHYFLAIPRLSRTSDGELRVGAQLRWDNFAGRLHQLKLTSERRQEDDGKGRSGFVHEIEYAVPRFFGSDFGLDFGIGTARKQVALVQDHIEYGEAVRDAQYVEFRLSRWINQSTGIQGLRYFAGLRVEHRTLVLQEGGAGPFSGGEDVSLVIGAENRLSHVDTYRRRGIVYGATLRFALDAIGSDFGYYRSEAHVAWYHPLSELRNLNVQARLGWSNGAPFGERSFALGGGEVLRGLEPGSAAGDVLAVLNVEYLSGFFSHPTWRWVIFADIGNVYPYHKIELNQQIIRGGVGLRWKLESLTNTDLRVDIAWDADQKRIQSYFSTHLTF